MPASCKRRTIDRPTTSSVAKLASVWLGRRTALLMITSLLTITILGCGPDRPDRVPVSGQVLLNGEPLTRGFVRFIHVSARASYGKIGPDGRFTLTCYDGQDGAVPGHFQVEVSANEGINESSMRWFTPKHYADYQTSGIELEITEATDDLKIELEGEGVPFVETFGR